MKAEEERMAAIQPFPGHSPEETADVWQPARSQLRFLSRKLRDVLVTLFLMSLLLFLVFQILPGDPVTMMLGTQATPEKRAALEADLRLDQGPLARYLYSVTGLFRQDEPSRSIRFQRPVRELIAARLGLTLGLAAFAFLLILILSLALALLCYWRQGSWLDRLISLLAQFFMSIPGFFLGIVLMLLFSFLFKSYLPGAYQKAGTEFWPRLRALFLPALAVALPKLSQAVQFLRTALIEGSQEDYLRTARSKGAGPWRLLFGHQLRNALLPFITAMALILADQITGSLVVEQVFVLPGAGRLLFSAIEARDLPLAQGLMLVLAFLVILINLISDLLCRAVDPRLGSADAGEGEGGRDA